MMKFHASLANRENREVTYHKKFQVYSISSTIDIRVQGLETSARPETLRCW